MILRWIWPSNGTPGELSVAIGFGVLRRSASISLPMKFYLPDPWGLVSIQWSARKALVIVTKIVFREVPLSR